jgi:hypothetical protein
MQNFTQFFSGNISAIEITNPLRFSSKIYQTSIKILATVETFSKSSFSQKNSKRKRIRGKCKIVAEICQNRIAGKNRFFRKFSVS